MATPVLAYLTAEPLAMVHWVGDIVVIQATLSTLTDDLAALGYSQEDAKIAVTATVATTAAIYGLPMGECLL